MLSVKTAVVSFSKDRCLPSLVFSHSLQKHALDSSRNRTAPLSLGFSSLISVLSLFLLQPRLPLLASAFLLLLLAHNATPSSSLPFSLLFSAHESRPLFSFPLNDAPSANHASHSPLARLLSDYWIER
ncbi:uncharacterized protein G2W53_009381 [Senna tora]|uniref:Uncharacterized protein n=1 Tax=Senna tora TaxID=362788 RepID=A0A834WYH4_9FABA|nr:uncharacterized protein G2W53_009381 [Senna tora]